jgi:hypothetical protein
MSKERDVRINNGLNTKEMSRQKASKETILAERGLKIKLRNNRKQEKWCQAKTASRE